VAAASPGPTLTVAIPTCNGAAHIGVALHSVLSQKGVDFELVVSDDQSDDRTLEIVRAIASDRARIEINSERLGLAGNWNRCAALARAPLVAIFHQDDVMLDGHLAAHVARFASDNAIGVTASASVVIDDRGRPVAESVVEHGGLGAVDRVLERGDLAEKMIRGNPLRCSGAIIKLAAFHEIGGFDSSLGYVLDWDFWLRLSRKWKVAWLARPSVQVRWHSASETHRFKTGLADLEETAVMLEKLFASDLKNRPDIARLRRAANERLGRAFLNRAHYALKVGHSKLAHEALRHAFKCSRRLFKTFVGDPKLCASMATLAVAPGLAARLFASKEPDAADRAGPS
jgi:glycosyltransferase involved in cell wall biosynthesis